MTQRLLQKLLIFILSEKKAVYDITLRGMESQKWFFFYMRANKKYNNI